MSVSCVNCTRTSKTLVGTRKCVGCGTKHRQRLSTVALCSSIAKAYGSSANGELGIMVCVLSSGCAPRCVMGPFQSEDCCFSVHRPMEASQWGFCTMGSRLLILCNVDKSGPEPLLAVLKLQGSDQADTVCTLFEDEDGIAIQFEDLEHPALIAEVQRDSDGPFELLDGDGQVQATVKRHHSECAVVTVEPGMDIVLALAVASCLQYLCSHSMRVSAHGLSASRRLSSTFSDLMHDI